MKWEMGVENIESVLEKIWDLHDKLSDAIHSTSRTHFLNSIRSHKSRTINGDVIGFPKRKLSENDNKNGFVYFKDISGVLDVDCSAAVQEAKSLNAIRSALENLEDQLEFFNSIERQWQTERDGAISRIEQSRVIVGRRLAEHVGKKYDVIKEAQDFVGEICETSELVSPAGNENNIVVVTEEEMRRGRRKEILKSSLNYVRRCLKVDCIGGVVGNAAMVAMSMFALIHFHQVPDNGNGIDININNNRRILHQLPKNQQDHRNMTRVNESQGSSSSSSSLNVLLGRG